MTPRVGVIGHIEWADFVVVDAVPQPGSITHTDEHFEVAAGGGAVAAVALRELAGHSIFLTAVGEDERGTMAVAELRGRGVEVYASVHAGRRQRRVVTFLDAAAERTIVIVGERLVPLASDQLPWDMCGDLDGVYFTASGDGVAAQHARRARVLVASSRAAGALEDVRCDVVICSAHDADEVGWMQEIDADVRVFTEGADGGRYETRDGSQGRWSATALPGPRVDSYGCGDHFAAGLTFGLASGMALGEALAIGARAGAYCLARRGPYGLS